MSSTFDVLSQEARDRLESFDARERRLFGELLDDAPTELQKEMLNRALAAGHGPAELHAFADEIRGMSDDVVFASCTLADADDAFSVVQRLRAEADPIYGMILNGFELSPKAEVDDSYPMPGTGRRPQRPIPALMVAEAPRARPSFEQESSVARGRKLDLNDLGRSPEPELSPSGKHLAPQPAPGREEKINAAVRGLGLTFKEQPVDGPELKLEKAIESASAALSRGVPIAVALGAKVGEYKRYALILQCQTSGKSRAFQLHDPHSHETVWVNEGDLLARTELPFANKTLRRITAIALPVNRT